MAFSSCRLCRQALLHKFHIICWTCMGSASALKFLPSIFMRIHPMALGLLRVNSCLNDSQNFIKLMFSRLTLSFLFSIDTSSNILSMRWILLSIMPCSLTDMGSSMPSCNKSLAWRIADMGLRISCAKLAVNCPKDISLVDIASAATSRNERTNNIKSWVSSWIKGTARTCMECWYKWISVSKGLSGLYFHRVTNSVNTVSERSIIKPGKYTLACLLNNHTRCSSSITTTASCTRCNTIWFKPRTRSNARRCFSADSVASFRYDALYDTSMATTYDAPINMVAEPITCPSPVGYFNVSCPCINMVTKIKAEV